MMSPVEQGFMFVAAVILSPLWFPLWCIGKAIQFIEERHDA